MDTCVCSGQSLGTNKTIPRQEELIRQCSVVHLFFFPLLFDAKMEDKTPAPFVLDNNTVAAMEQV